MAKQSMETQIAVIATKVETIEQTVSNIEQKMEGHYVTKEEFDPIKKITYGVVSIILTTVIVGLLALVIKK